jgi:hypothetical protein
MNDRNYLSMYMLKAFAQKHQHSYNFFKIMEDIYE